MSPLRITVAGCTGRMGQAIVRLASAEPGLAIVCGTTLPGDARIGADVGAIAGVAPLSVRIGTTPTASDVLIDFTNPDGCAANARWCADAGAALVSGTTGLEPHHHDALRSAAARVPVLWAPNMSVGVHVLVGLVRQAAATLGVDWDIEIVEAHHRQKADAPSGTAKALLQAAANGRGQSPADVAVYGRQGITGARSRGEIGVHAVRMGGVVGEHDVCFATPTERITLAHRAESRDVFAAGALRAARWIAGRPPALYAMPDVLA